MEEVRDIGISSRMWCYLHTCEIQPASWKVEITPTKFLGHALNSILQSFYILDHPRLQETLVHHRQLISQWWMKGICSGISEIWEQTHTLNRKLTSFWHRKFKRSPGFLKCPRWGLVIFCKLEYPLVNIHKAIENGPLIVDLPIKNGDFP